MTGKFQEVSRGQFDIFIKYRQDLTKIFEYLPEKTVVIFRDFNLDKNPIIVSIDCPKKVLNVSEYKYFILKREYKKMIEDLNVLAAAKCL